MPQLTIANRFDAQRCRRYLNEELTVFHCHHYTTLFTQLADDAEQFHGPKHLRDAAADSVLGVLRRYCAKNGVTSKADKVDIAQQYFSVMGLGKLTIDIAAQTAEMAFSHVDSGWLKKWGTRDKPVNYIGQGYIAAVFALVHDDEPGHYEVLETRSIVSGAKTSQFTVKIKRDAQ